MPDFPRPKVVVSKCLEFDHCRYDGSMITSEFVKSLVPYVDFIPICPEVEMGLGVPRAPIRLVSQDGELTLFQPVTGRDVTDKMQAFLDRFLSTMPRVDGFILKFRSPSCGLKGVKVYPGKGDVPAVSQSPGFFGRAVLNSFSGLAVEDEGRLRNFNIREHFLTKLYTLATFRDQVESRGSPRDLLDFHTRNKLLLMAHNRKKAQILGNIVANREELDFPSQVRAYREYLSLALSRPPRYNSKAEVLIRSMGHFSGRLSREERDLYLRNIESYRARRLPSAALLSTLQGWIVRFGDRYLKEQTLFHPFPEELIQLCTDSQCEWAGESLFERE